MKSFGQPYPSHLSDPLRREIAEQYIRHEFRKLLPSVKDGQVWRQIDADVGQWFSGNALFTPVRGFWNAFYAIARGLRFKNLLPILTSKNIRWQERSVQLDDLWFGASFEALGFIGHDPSVNQVKIILRRPEHQKDKQKLLEVLRQKGGVGVFRDHDLLIINKKDGKLRVIDGNRRVFEALWEDKQEIAAYVGEPIGEPEIFEQWVPAGFLRDLLFLHSRNGNPSAELTNVLAHTVAEALKNSKSGQLEWQAICHLSVGPLDKLLYREVLNKLSLDQYK